MKRNKEKCIPNGKEGRKKDRKKEAKCNDNKKQQRQQQQQHNTRILSTEYKAMRN